MRAPRRGVTLVGVALPVAMIIVLALIVTAGQGEAQRGSDDELPQALLVERGAFTFVEIWLDSGDEPLAAYQIQVSALDGDVRIVGIEGGEHPAFREPPYYDPAAMRSDRVILGDFSTAAAEDLPSGRTRIATIHLQAIGDYPRLECELESAATVDGRVIEATVELREGRAE